MPISIPKPVQELVHFGQRAFIELGLKETTALSDEDIQQFKNDYPLEANSNPVKFQRNDSNYPDFALKILDYFMFKGLDDILATVGSANILQGYSNIQKTVFQNMELNGCNSLSRYLGMKNRVPDFADNEKLYKKMLWLEWMLTQAMELWQQGIIPDYTVPKVGGPQKQFIFRLNAVTAFLNTYISKHPEKAEELKQFRATYTIENISHSHAIALKIVAPQLEPEEEKYADSDEEDSDAEVRSIPSPEAVTLREALSKLDEEEILIHKEYELIIEEGKRLKKEYRDLHALLVISANKIDYLEKKFTYFGYFADSKTTVRIQNLKNYIAKEIKGDISNWLSAPHEPKNFQPHGKLAKLGADIRENTTQDEFQLEILDKIKNRKKKLNVQLEKIKPPVVRRRRIFKTPEASRSLSSAFMSPQTNTSPQLAPIESEQDSQPRKKAWAIASMLFGGLTVGAGLAGLGIILLLEIPVSPLVIPATLFGLALGGTSFYYGASQMQLFGSPKKPESVDSSSRSNTAPPPSARTSSNRPTPQSSRRLSFSSLSNSPTFFNENTLPANSSSSPPTTPSSESNPQNPGSPRP